MRDIEARTAMREKGGVEQFVHTEMWQEIRNIEIACRV